MFEGADIALVDRVGLGVEVVIAERLQSGELLVDLTLLCDKGRLSGPLGSLGVRLLAGCGDRV